jgi:hypothetical protein
MLVIKNLFSFAIWFGTIACVAMIAYGGFLLVLNAANVSYRDAARKLFTNAGIGLVIVLAAWLLVDTVFTTLTKTTLASATSVFSGGTDCLGDSRAIADAPATPSLSAATQSTIYHLELDDSEDGVATAGYPASKNLAASLSSLLGIDGCANPLNRVDSTHLSSDQALVLMKQLMEDCSHEVGLSGVVYPDGTSHWTFSPVGNRITVDMTKATDVELRSLKQDALDSLKDKGVLMPNLGTFYNIHIHPAANLMDPQRGSQIGILYDPPSLPDLLKFAALTTLGVLAVDDSLGGHVKFYVVAPEGVYQYDTTGFSRKYESQMSSQMQRAFANLYTKDEVVDISSIVKDATAQIKPFFDAEQSIQDVNGYYQLIYLGNGSSDGGWHIDLAHSTHEQATEAYRTAIQNYAADGIVVSLIQPY